MLDAADDLGYVPSAAARQLASGRARTIGLVITNAENLRVDAFVPQALYSLNRTAHRRGFRVLVEALEDAKRPGSYRDLVRQADRRAHRAEPPGRTMCACRN